MRRNMKRAREEEQGKARKSQLVVARNFQNAVYRSTAAVGKARQHRRLRMRASQWFVFMFISCITQNPLTSHTHQSQTAQDALRISH